MASTMVASRAPRLVLIFFLAQSPYALEPPERFISTTMMPKMTRNATMPRLPPTAVHSVSNVLVTAKTGLKFAYRKPPTRQPKNREV